MKNLYLKIILYSLALASGSCNSNDYYTPDIIKISTRDTSSQAISGSLINSSVQGIFKIDLIDTILICITRNPKHFVTLINTENDSCLLNLCVLGKTRNEFLSVNSFKQHDINWKGDHIMYVTNSLHQIKSINLTQSIKEQRTICDTSYNIDVNKFSPFLDNNKIFFKKKNVTYFIPSHNVQGTEFYPPRYILSEEMNDFIYDIYPKVVTSKFIPHLALDIYESYTYMKPDKTKVVDAMICMDYITILDLKTKKSIGVKSNKSMAFEKINDIREEDAKNIIRKEINDIYVTDNYILVLRDGRFISDIHNNTKPYIPQIIIYDWEGNYVKQFTLNESIVGLTYDIKKHILYGFDRNDNIYKYQIII